MLCWAARLDLSKSSERAEDEVANQLLRSLPSHWVIVGNLPPKHSKGISTKQIDALLIADRHIYMIEVKSHRGGIRVRPDHPFQRDGKDISDSTNHPNGFWLKHDARCYDLKDFLEEEYKVERSCIVPKMIFCWADSLDYGRSKLEKDVTDTETFIRLVQERERTSRKPPIEQDLVTRLCHDLLDDETLIIPAREYARSRPATPSRTKSQSGDPQAVAREQDKAVRASYGAPIASVSGKASGADFIASSDGIITTASASSIREASRFASASSVCRTAQAPPDPTPQQVPWLKILGWLVLLWLVLSVGSCVFEGIRIFLAGPQALNRTSPSRPSMPDYRTEPPALSPPIQTNPTFSVQSFSSPRRYAIHSPGGGGVWIQLGPGRNYSSGPLLQHGDEVTGSGTTVGEDGVTWIAVTGPDGTSGFIMEHLLRPWSERRVGPENEPVSSEPLDVSPSALRAEDGGQREPAVEAEKEHNEPARTVICILPSGREAQLSSDQCRQSSGVVYRHDEN